MTYVFKTISIPLQDKPPAAIADVRNFALLLIPRFSTKYFAQHLVLIGTGSTT
jgi:hypothetical protein